MTEYERMLAGMLYDPGNEEILAEQVTYQDKMHEFNCSVPSDAEARKRIMKEMFAECGEDTFIQGPVHANWGGRHVHLGSHIYINFNVTLVDDGHIYIGDYTQLGPNVTVATAGHPVLP